MNLSLKLTLQSAPILYTSSGPPGNPLLFVEPDGVDSIGLSADIIDQLSTEQQTYFNANPSWDSYALFWADVSVQSWFNDENIIGTETGGVWIGAADTPQATLDKVLKWFDLYVYLEMLDSLEMTDNLEMT